MKKKQCLKCGKTKAVGEFHKKKNTKDGLRNWCKKCCNAHHRTTYDEIFIEALCHYSQPGDPWVVQCAHCGRTDVDILTLDHVDNDGHIYDKNGRRFSSWIFAYWLRLHDWPEDIKLQVLCFNCNAKRERVRCREQTVIDNSKRSEKNRKLNKYCNEKRRQTRLEALQHYGPNGEAKCACCSEDDYDVLDLDHINGRGKWKTPFEKLGGAFLAQWLKRNHWPNVPLQVLCQNCNCQKYFNSVHSTTIEV